MIYVLYNPQAGNNTGFEKAKELYNIYKDKQLELINVITLNDYASFFREKIKNDDSLVIAGGDGTLNRFINETNLRSRLPSSLRESFNKNLQQQKNIAFTLDNLKYFYEKLISEIPTSYNETVSKIFDKLTVESEYSESAWCKNIHYFNGWKTNKAYKINGKSIIYHNHSDWYYGLDDTLSDLLIIFENIAGEKDEYMRSKEFVSAIKLKLSKETPMYQEGGLFTMSSNFDIHFFDTPSTYVYGKIS